MYGVNQHFQSSIQQPQMSSSKSTNTTKALHRIQRLMQYNDLPLDEQIEPSSLTDESSTNHSLFRAPVVQEPILEPFDPPSISDTTSSNISNIRAANNSWIGVSLPEAATTTKTTTTITPIAQLGSNNKTGQMVTQTVNISTNKSSSNKINTTKKIQSRPTLAPSNLTTSSRNFNNNLFNGITAPFSAVSDVHNMFRYMNEPELESQLKAIRLVPPLNMPPVWRLPTFNSPARFVPTNAPVIRHQLAQPIQAHRLIQQQYVSTSPQPPISLASRLWNLFGPKSSTAPHQTSANEVTRFNWMYPGQALKKRRNQLPPHLVVTSRRKVPRQSRPVNLAQSASHLNSYTLEPSVDDELDSSYEQDPNTFHLPQDDSSSEFSSSELATTNFAGAEPLANGEYPVTLTTDTATEQQDLLTSTLLKAQEQQLKRRKKIPKVPLTTQQLGTSYLDLVNLVKSDAQPVQVVSTLDEPQTTVNNQQSNSNNPQEEQATEVSEVKKSKTQLVPQDDTTDTSEQQQQQAPSTSTGIRKPPRIPHTALRHKRPRHPLRTIRAHRHLQNFYDHSPAGGDLQPSSTFLRWKYPHLYDDNEDEGETELNIRFFNNFSRMGSFTGLARNAATATLIISLVLLIISNICMATTYFVHGLSLLSAFYAPSTTTGSNGYSMARPKNVTQLSYSNWDSILPPFIRDRSSTATTTTTLAPLLTSRSIPSAHQHQQQPSMTFDSEIRALGDPWK